jgi:hypothetical protein
MAELKNNQTAQQTASAEASYEDEWYDLLPIEKKLIKSSLGLGLSLLVVFIIIFKVL